MNVKVPQFRINFDVRIIITFKSFFCISLSDILARIS